MATKIFQTKLHWCRKAFFVYPFFLTKILGIPPVWCQHITSNFCPHLSPLSANISIYIWLKFPLSTVVSIQFNNFKNDFYWTFTVVWFLNPSYPRGEVGDVIIILCWKIAISPKPIQRWTSDTSVNLSLSVGVQ